MGGGSKSGGGEAAAARADEQKRQADIRAGTARINAIFDGGTYGTGALGSDAVYDPNGSYYLADGTLWTPTAAPTTPTTPATPATSAPGNPGQNEDWTRRLGHTGGPKTDAALTPEQQFAKLLKEGSLYSGTTTSTGFNNDFFNQRRQAFIDYATPQIEDQYGKAQRELTFALDRGGLLDSSVRGQKAGELQQLYDLNKQQIADQALSYEGEARSAVEDARSNLIATLNATGDAQGAANAAIARSAILSKPAAYSPLANLFADFTAGLGTQAALEKANYYAGSGAGGQQIGRYSTGLFAPKTSSVKVSA